MRKEMIWLATGVVVTLLFIMMSFSGDANVYEQMTYNGEFNNELFTLGLYPMMAFITVALTWGIAAIYYYVIDSVHFDRWYHWAVMLVVTAVLVPAVCYALCDYFFNKEGVDYTLQLAQFEVQHIVFTVVLFTLASMAMRWWSGNCRHTPFPQ